MNILITGGTGFLGTHLVPLLRKNGHSLTLLSRGKPPADWLKGDHPVRHVQADLKDAMRARDQAAPASRRKLSETK